MNQRQRLNSWVTSGTSCWDDPQPSSWHSSTGPIPLRRLSDTGPQKSLGWSRQQRYEHGEGQEDQSYAQDSSISTNAYVDSGHASHEDPAAYCKWGDLYHGSILARLARVSSVDAPRRWPTRWPSPSSGAVANAVRVVHATDYGRNSDAAHHYRSKLDDKSNYDQHAQEADKRPEQHSSHIRWQKKTKVVIAEVFVPQISNPGFTPAEQIKAIAQAGTINPQEDRDWQAAWQAGHAPFTQERSSSSSSTLTDTKWGHGYARRARLQKVHKLAYGPWVDVHDALQYLRENGIPHDSGMPEGQMWQLAVQNGWDQMPLPVRPPRSSNMWQQRVGQHVMVRTASGVSGYEADMWRGGEEPIHPDQPFYYLTSDSGEASNYGPVAQHRVRLENPLHVDHQHGVSWRDQIEGQGYQPWTQVFNDHDGIVYHWPASQGMYGYPERTWAIVRQQQQQ